MLENERPQRFLSSILNDDGSWRVITDKDKKKHNPKMSILQDKDAIRVRKGTTLAQKCEDQIKSPTGSHRRRQSSFRSSFLKSKSFGGITNGGITEMIDLKLEPDTNIAIKGAERTNDFSSEKRKKTLPKSYDERLDIIDLECIPSYKPVTDFVESLQAVLEKTPLHKLSHVDDPALKVRQLETQKIVPDAAQDPDEPLIQPDQVNVVPDDVASKERLIVVDIPELPSGRVNTSGPISNVASPYDHGVLFPNVTILKSPKNTHIKTKVRNGQ